MKPRTALHILVGLLIAVTLVFFASNLQAGRGSSLSDMVDAQRHTPLLWIVDACAVGIVGGMWWAAVVLNHFHTFVDHQAQQHLDQLDDMIEHTSDLESVNDAYADKIERLEAELARQFRDLVDQIATLEAAADTRRQVFEIEAQRLSEHANLLLYSQLEDNTRQMEAMSMALQLQRGDFRRLRHNIYELQNELAPQHALRLKPVEFIDARDEPLAITAYPATPEAPPAFILESDEALEQFRALPKLDSDVLALPNQPVSRDEEAPLPAGRAAVDGPGNEPVRGGVQPERWTHSEATA